MGNTHSSSSQQNKMSDEAHILEMCKGYYQTWNGKLGIRPQSDVFREIVPIEAVDFDGEFHRNGLNEIFTNTNLPLKVKYGYNCNHLYRDCLLYTSPSPRDGLLSRMPSSA